MAQNFRWQYPSKIEPISQAGENITLDKWFRPASTPRSPSRDLTAAILAGSLFFVHVVQAPAETVTVDKWYQPIQQPIFQKKLRISDYHFAPVSTASETITLDKWFRNTQQPLFDRKRLQYTYKFFFAESLHTIPEQEIIRPDKWYQEHQPNPWRPKVHASQVPYFFWHPGKEALEAGIRFEHIQRPDQVFRKHKRAHYMRPDFFDPLPIPPVVETTLDMWFSESLLFNPVLPRKRPWTYLFYVRHVVPLASPTLPAHSRFNVISSRGAKNVIHQDSKTINQYQQ